MLDLSHPANEGSRRVPAQPPPRHQRTAQCTAGRRCGRRLASQRRGWGWAQSGFRWSKYNTRGYTGGGAGSTAAFFGLPGAELTQ